MRRAIATLIRLVALALFPWLGPVLAEPPRVAPTDLLPRHDWPLGDPPARLDPKTAPQEEEADRTAAAALFVRGRIAEQREEYAAALRHYQRAHRLDPRSATILRAIVPLAFELKRNHEAARYAVLAAEAQPSDALLLGRLADHLEEEGDKRRAMRMLELALQLPAATASPPSPASLAMRFQLGRMQLAAGDARAAVKSLEPVRDALLAKDPRSLAPELRKLLEQKAEVTWGLLGEAFFDAERLDEAEILFRRAESARPQAALSALRQAKLSLARKRVPASLGHLATYFSSGSEEAGEEAVQVLERAVAAGTANAADRDKEFERRLREFREKAPGHRPLALRLAKVAAARGDWEEADKLTTSVVERLADFEAERRWIEARRKRGDPERLLDALGAIVVRRMSLDSLESELDALKKDEALVSRLFAAAETRKAVATDARSGSSLLAAAFLAIEAKQSAAAEPLIEAALAAKQPGKGATLLAAGLAWSSAGEEAKAAAAWQRAIDEQALPQKTADLHYYVSGSLATIGKTDEALKAARKAAALEPDSITMQIRPLWVLYYSGRYVEAELGYKALVNRYDSRRDSEPLRVALRESRLALSHLAMLAGRQAEADEWIEEALDEYPEDPGALNDLGYLWADRGVHLSRAERMIERAVAASPENSSYRDSLGWVYFRRGKLEAAVEELRKAVGSESPGGVVWDHFGDACRATDRREEAVSAWKKAAEAFDKEGKKEKSAAVNAKIAAAGSPQ